MPTADDTDAAAEAALDRAQFDPALVWDAVAGLVVAGRTRDPDAFAAAVGVFSQSPPSQFRNTQRVGVALVIITLLEVLGPTPTVADVQRLAADIEPEVRRFMRANRWDIADTLAPLVTAEMGVHFQRATVIGCGCVGVLVDRLPPNRNPATFHDDVRGRALRIAAHELARRQPTTPAPWPAVAGPDQDDPPGDGMPVLP